MSTIALPPGLPLGFRFHPTDEELINGYLKPKLLGLNPEVDRIVGEVDFCKFEPWELPSKSKIESKDRMWLFFCLQIIKYVSSKRSWKITGKRTTGKGSWKITGKEREIKDKDTKQCIGKKRTLVYKGPTPGEKTNWVIQLYYIIPDHPLHDQSIYVLCRLKRKADDTDNISNPEEGANETADTLDPEERANGMAHISVPEEGTNGLTTTPDLEEDTNNMVNTSDREEGINEMAYILDHEEGANDMTNTLDSEKDTNNIDNTSDSGEGENEIANVLYHQEGINNMANTLDLEELWAYSDEKMRQALSSMPMFSPLRDFMDDLDGIDISIEGINEQMTNLCYLKNKANDDANTLDFNEGEPSGDITSKVENPVIPATISLVCGHKEISNRLKDNLCDNYNGLTRNDRFSKSAQPTSLKRPYPLDAPASVGANVEGVDGWVKRTCSLANLSISSWRITPIAHESI